MDSDSRDPSDHRDLLDQNVGLFVHFTAHQPNKKEDDAPDIRSDGDCDYNHYCSSDHFPPRMQAFERRVQSSCAWKLLLEACGFWSGIWPRR